MKYVLSFACAKERTKEKHTGNDIQPLPDALIKHRAGLDFFGTFCIKAKSTETPYTILCSFFACAKERTKEKHTGNDLQPLPAP